MKLVTYVAGAGPRLGAVVGDSVVDVARHISGMPADMIALIRHWGSARPRLEQALAGRPDRRLSDVRLRAPSLDRARFSQLGSTISIT